MPRKGGRQMRQRELLGAGRYDLRGIANRGQRYANRTLRLAKSPPDSIRRRIAQSGQELAKRLQFAAIAGGLSQELPQVVGRQKQAFDLARHPNAEGAAAASRAATVAAVDPPAVTGRIAIALSTELSL